MISSSLLCCCAWFSLDSLEPAPIELAINLSRLCSPFFFFFVVFFSSSFPFGRGRRYLPVRVQYYILYIYDIPIRLMNALCCSCCRSRTYIRIYREKDSKLERIHYRKKKKKQTTVLRVSVGFLLVYGRFRLRSPSVNVFCLLNITLEESCSAGLVLFYITLSCWEGILFGSTRTNFPEGAVDADRFTN